MRVFVQAAGSAGDVHPYVGLGKALRVRGHEVFIQTNEAFRDNVVSAGLEFVQCGDAAALDATMADPDLWHPRKGISVVVRDGVRPSLRPAYDQILEHLEPGRTLLVASPLGFAARIAAEKHGVPVVTTHLAPVSFRSSHRSPQFPGTPLPRWMPGFLKRTAFRLMDFVADGVFGPPVNEFRASLDLPPLRRIFDEWICGGDLLLGLFPEWFAPPQPDWPKGLRMTGFPLWDEGDAAPLDADLAAWLDADSAPIVFTAGSANVHGEPYYRASIDAAASLERRAVLVTRNPAVLPSPLPAHARHVRYAPFSRLFPRAAAVVHHGGIGTTARGLAAGVPTLVCAMGFDQFDNASRVVDLGAGAALPMRRYSSPRAARALSRLLADPSVAAASRRAAERIAAATPREAACDAMESVSLEPVV